MSFLWFFENLWNHETAEQIEFKDSISPYLKKQFDTSVSVPVSSSDEEETDDEEEEEEVEEEDGEDEEGEDGEDGEDGEGEWKGTELDDENGEEKESDTEKIPDVKNLQIKSNDEGELESLSDSAKVDKMADTSSHGGVSPELSHRNTGTKIAVSGVQKGCVVTDDGTKDGGYTSDKG